MSKLNVGQDLIDFFYPIGCIYMSMNSTSPKTLFGGEWTQITDKFLYCTTSSKGTGGSTTTGSTTLTVNQIPSHTHDTESGRNIGTLRFLTDNNTTGHDGKWKAPITSNDEQYGLHDQGKLANTGGGKGHTHPQNLPPYMTCYAWYRTA